jgi:pterin-4a-carbinolamine dehydratase
VDEVAKITGWSVKNSTVDKIYEFASFPDAVASIVRISYPLQAVDHHPEIRNVYGTVYFGFTTHDQGNRVTISTSKPLA